MSRYKVQISSEIVSEARKVSVDNAIAFTIENLGDQTAYHGFIDQGEGDAKRIPTAKAITRGYSLPEGFKFKGDIKINFSGSGEKLLLIQKTIVVEEC